MNGNQGCFLSDAKAASMKNARDRGIRSGVQTGTKALLSTLVCLALCLAGCTRTSHGMLASGARPGALRIGVTDEPDSLNPLFSHTIVADDVAALTLAPLFRYDPQGNFVPELADKVPSRENGDISADGRTVKLHFRRNLQWQDGQPLDVRDLLFTWHAVMNPKNSTKLRGSWQNIARIDTPNLQTAIITLKQPDATILSLFAGGGDAAYAILPAHLLAQLPDLNHATWNAAPIGSGPWMLARWDHGSSLTFVPNPHYWRGVPKLNGLRLVILPDAQTMVTALLAHEVDAVLNVPSDRVIDVENNAQLHVLHHNVATYLHLDFNCRDSTLADMRVRKAILEAIRWPAILSRVYHNAGTLATSDIFPTSWAAPLLQAYEYRPAEAAQLLDAAGWRMNPIGQRLRNGIPLHLTLMSGNTNPLSARTELLIADALQKIGVRVELKNSPANYLFAEDGPLYTGKYQMAWMSDTRAPDPDNAANWGSDAIPPNGGNTVFLRDPLVDRLAHAARITLGRAERRALYQQEESRLHELAPSLTFAWQSETMASWGPIYGIQPATYYSSYWNSWEWHTDAHE
jgi:peptide/nickel transport system substrate-binding protein